MNFTPSFLFQNVGRLVLFVGCLMAGGGLWLGLIPGCSPNVPPGNAVESTGEHGTEYDASIQSGTDSVLNPEAGHESTSHESSTSSEKDPIADTSGTVSSVCRDAWVQVKASYTDATNLTSCDGNAAAQKVVQSLMNLSGISISNNGNKEIPCIDVRCEGSWVYVVSNALPHYDFVQTTPNPLKATILFFRVAVQPEAIAGRVPSEDISTMKGCEQAYQQYASNPNQATQREPSGFCTFQNTDVSYMTATEAGKTVTFRKLSCLGTIGFSITGVPVFGPNEGPMPDPWGNPVFFSPDKAGDPYIPGDLRAGAALDLCLGHTANTMHYHGFNEACFQRDAQRKPKSSYAQATATWDYAGSLTSDCTEVSGIVGWSMDGIPIKGPCVCTKRNTDGTCATLKRVRSGFVYRGLKAWGNGNLAALNKEGVTCQQQSDCCTNTSGCKYQCKYTVVDDANSPGGTQVSKRCVLRDYTWCVHHFQDRSQQNVAQTNFVYLDRCNGYQSADGYAYHATTTFPHVLGCTRYESLSALGTQAGHGGNNNNNNNNNTGNPKSCQNDNECRDACPQGSKGCVCRPGPPGQSGRICVPSCQQTQDCPAGLTCDPQAGFCRR